MPFANHIHNVCTDMNPNNTLINRVARFSNDWRKTKDKPSTTRVKSVINQSKLEAETRDRVASAGKVAYGGKPLLSTQL